MSCDDCGKNCVCTPASAIWEPCCANPKCDGVACKAPPREPMTLDQARAAIGRTLAEGLRRSILDLETELGGAKPDDPDVADARTMLVASKELHDALLVQAKRFERPLLLRPERRVKVVRG